MKSRFNQVDAISEKGEGWSLELAHVRSADLGVVWMAFQLWHSW